MYIKIIKILIYNLLLTCCASENDKKNQEKYSPIPDQKDTKNDNKKNIPIDIPNDIFIIDKATKEKKGINRKKQKYIQFSKDLYQYYKNNSDKIFNDFKENPITALENWYPNTGDAYSQYLYSQQFFAGLQSNKNFKKFCEDMKKEYEELNKQKDKPELTEKQKKIKEWFKTKGLLPDKYFMEYLEPQAYKKWENKVYFGYDHHKRDKNWKDKSEEEKDKIIKEEYEKSLNDSLLFAGVLRSKTCEAKISKNLKNSFEKGIKNFKNKDGLWIIGCCDYCGEWIYKYQSQYFNDKWHFDQDYLEGRFYTDIKCENPTCLAYNKTSQTETIKYFLKGNIFNIRCALGDKDIFTKQIDATKEVKLFTPTKELHLNFKDPNNLFENAYNTLDIINKKKLKINVTVVNNKGN